MRLLLSLALLQVSIFSFGQTPATPRLIDSDSLLEARTRKALGKPFPAFAAANEQGKINKDSLKGKVVLINFWFEGCHPCIAEFGALNELAEKLKGNKDFEFISLINNRTWAKPKFYKHSYSGKPLTVSTFRRNCFLNYPID